MASFKLMTIHYQASPFLAADFQHMACFSAVPLKYSNLCLVAFQYAGGARYQQIGGYQLIQTASYNTKLTTYCIRPTTVQYSVSFYSLQKLVTSNYLNIILSP